MFTSESRDTVFPSLRERTYLNTAAEGIPPRQVIAAIHQYAEDKLLGMDGRILHQRQWEDAKQQVAIAFGLMADEVSICSCSSEAYNMAAMALQLKKGDEVIINDLDFPAGSTPWLQPTCPATVRIWRSRDGALHTEDLIPLLGTNSRLVTTSLVSFYNGYMIPLEEVVAAIRHYSPAMCALDITQALGRVPLNLTDVDLIISSTHKWILASHGGGLVGVPKSRASAWTVPAGGWFNLTNAFDDDRFQRANSRPGAAGFTVGMPNYAAVYAIRAALQYIHEIGVCSIRNHADRLMRLCIDGLLELPVQLITPIAAGSLAGIVAFQHPAAVQLHQRLHEQDIHIMAHAGRLRVAIHGYNTTADIERFLSALAQALDEI